VISSGGYSGSLGPFITMVMGSSEYKVTSGHASFEAEPNARQTIIIVATTPSLKINFMYANPTPTGITWMSDTNICNTYTVDSSTNSVSIGITMFYKYSSESSSKYAPQVMLYAYNTSQLYCHIRVYWGNDNTATTCQVKVQLSGSSSSSTYTCTRSSTSDIVTFTITQVLLSQLSKYTCTVTSYS
jgi:hypothetical protein